MTTVTASYDTLFSQASSTVSGYFGEAIQIIDARFGKGYAQNNPHLVGELVSAMTSDFRTSSFGKVIGELADALRDLDFSAR